MKRYLLILSALMALTVLRAEYIDFGEQYGFWKGDFAVADIDGDGDLDIVFSGVDGDPGEVKGAILLNDGNGNFTEQQGENVIKMGQGGNIQFGDIDGDGDLDIIFAGWRAPEASRGIALNDGNGVFTLADSQKYPVNQAPKVTSCGFADFNLDGLLDYYFFANYTNDESNCIVYIQQADGSFQALPYTTTNLKDLKLNEAEVSVIDFDNNGTPDIFITAGNESNNCQDNGENQRFSVLFKNDGFGKFTPFSKEVAIMKSNGTSTWADVDGDGYVDLLLNGDGHLCSGEDNNRINRFFKNKNGADFETKTDFDYARQGSMSNGTALVDWDNDGKLDFFSGGWDQTANKQTLDLFLGDDPSSFTFTKSALGNTELPGISEQALRVADLNGDNKVDLLISGFSGGNLNYGRRIAGWFKNTSPNAAVLPTAPVNLNEEYDSDLATVTFTWEAPADIIGKPGITYNLSLRNTTTGKWFYNPMAVVGGDKNGWRQLAGRPGNVYTNKTFYLYDLPDGVYEWTVQVINGSYLGGAFADIRTFTIGNPSGITSESQLAKPKIFTSEGEINIQYNNVYANNTTLRIVNVNGAVIASQAFTGDVTMTLPAGVYIIELQQGNDVFRTKIVI